MKRGRREEGGGDNSDYVGPFEEERTREVDTGRKRRKDIENDLYSIYGRKEKLREEEGTMEKEREREGGGLSPSPHLTFHFVTPDCINGMKNEDGRRRKREGEET